MGGGGGGGPLALVLDETAQVPLVQGGDKADGVVVDVDVGEDEFFLGGEEASSEVGVGLFPEIELEGEFGV